MLKAVQSSRRPAALVFLFASFAFVAGCEAEWPEEDRVELSGDVETVIMGDDLRVELMEEGSRYAVNFMARRSETMWGGAAVLFCPDGIPEGRIVLEEDSVCEVRIVAVHEGTDWHGAPATDGYVEIRSGRLRVVGEAMLSPMWAIDTGERIHVRVDAVGTAVRPEHDSYET